jgi:hypothetical protein
MVALAIARVVSGRATSYASMFDEVQCEGLSGRWAQGIGGDLSMQVPVIRLHEHKQSSRIC